MQWHSYDSFPELTHNQIHIWRANLKQNSQQISELTKLLNQKEQNRSERFKVEQARNNFIIARGTLRSLLAKYLHSDPKEIVFKQNSYGKLFLENDILKFNLSHSNDYALFIFAKSYQVGIDIERVRNNFDFITIAQKFFSSQEVVDLLATPKEQQLHAFFNCWSRKEAFIKGIGKGVFFALDKFAVQICTKTTGKLKLTIDTEKLSELEQTNWSLEALNPGNDYVGAFAVSGQDYEINCYDTLSGRAPGVLAAAD